MFEQARPAVPPRHLTIERRDEADAVTFVIGGEIDLANTSLLEQHLLEAQSRTGASIVLDLGAVEFIDSTGLRILLNAHNRAAETGGSLRLVQVPTIARRLFGLAGVDRCLDVAV